MSAPVVFISHFRVDDVESYVRMTDEWVLRLEAEKPQTAAFLHYLDPDSARVTVVHVFADASAMDRHFEGADERAKVAQQVMRPERWEIYGPASEDAVSVVQRNADAAGVPLEVYPDYVGGFLRLAAHQTSA